jgi:hypothetical protein
MLARSPLVAGRGAGRLAFWNPQAVPTQLCLANSVAEFAIVKQNG